MSYQSILLYHITALTNDRFVIGLDHELSPFTLQICKSSSSPVLMYRRLVLKSIVSGADEVLLRYMIVYFYLRWAHNLGLDIRSVCLVQCAYLTNYVPYLTTLTWLISVQSVTNDRIRPLLRKHYLKEWSRWPQFSSGIFRCVTHIDKELIIWSVPRHSRWCL